VGRGYRVSSAFARRRLDARVDPGIDLRCGNRQGGKKPNDLLVRAIHEQSALARQIDDRRGIDAEFDSTQPVKVKGTIAKMEWSNPHAWLYVDVKEPDGKVVNWRFELGAPNALIRLGWKTDSVPVGVEVQVEGFRAKAGGPVANGRSIKLADGRELFYLAPDGSMMSVRVDTRTELTATTPARLFPTDITPDPGLPQYGVTADGQRFLGLERAEGGFTFILNWLNAKGRVTKDE